MINFRHVNIVRMDEFCQFRFRIQHFGYDLNRVHVRLTGCPGSAKNGCISKFVLFEIRNFLTTLNQNSLYFPN